MTMDSEHIWAGLEPNTTFVLKALIILQSFTNTNLCHTGNPHCAAHHLLQVPHRLVGNACQ